MKKYVFIYIVAITAAFIGSIGLIVHLNKQNTELRNNYSSLETYLDTLKNVNATLVVTKQELASEINSNELLRQELNNLRIKKNKVQRIETVNTVVEVRDSLVFKDKIITRDIDTTLNNPNYELRLVATSNKIETGLKLSTDINVVSYVSKKRQKGLCGWFKKRITVRNNFVTASNPCVRIEDTKFIEIENK